MPRLRDLVTLPQYFRQHGYIAWSGGKIFHQPHGKWSDPQSWDGQYSTKMGTPWPPDSDRYRHGMRDEFSNKILARLIDWAPLENAKEETQDWKTAQGAAAFLRQDHDKPFFLACGIYRPHLSWYAPKEFFELHPLDEIQLPAYLETDLDDVPSRGRVMAGNEFEIVKNHGQWKQAVQGYLAATSFADACVGVVLDALEETRYLNNTIIVLWGDHGYHLGQKNHIAKSALWQPATRTPLIIHVPSEAAGAEPNIAKSCKRPVSLVDLYPTLIDLCGLPQRDDLDGRSIAPLLRDPTIQWPYPAIITHSPHWHGVNHAIRSQRYHYIRYRDGGEELYDMREDPNQWRNLADNPTFTNVKKELRKWLPKTNAEHFRSESR
jgi:arylsulfatase A-like enzyme